jgi:hypothetical protein
MKQSTDENGDLLPWGEPPDHEAPEGFEDEMNPGALS